MIQQYTTHGQLKHTNIVQLIRVSHYSTIMGVLHHDLRDMPRFMPAENREEVGLMRCVIQGIADALFEEGKRLLGIYQSWLHQEPLVLYSGELNIDNAREQIVIYREILDQFIKLERRGLHAEKEEDELRVEAETDDVAVSQAWEKFKNTIETGGDDDDD